MSWSARFASQRSRLRQRASNSSALRIVRGSRGEEVGYGERLDTREAGAASCADPYLATVGAIRPARARPRARPARRVTVTRAGPGADRARHAARAGQGHSRRSGGRCQNAGSNDPGSRALGWVRARTAARAWPGTLAGACWRRCRAGRVQAGLPVPVATWWLHDAQTQQSPTLRAGLSL